MLSLGVWLAEFFAGPIREKADENRKMLDAFNENDKLKNRKQEIEDEITAIKRERTRTLGSRLITMDNAQNLKRMLDNHYRATAGLFQTELRSRRTSEGSNHQQTPIIEEIPPLDDVQPTDNYHVNTSQS